jgi:type IV pilus assembly protein PilA
MKKENKGMKKTSNKGFSLVELIVVIAIMGVLMVVLAPQYLKYVEKSRLQKDNSALGEIAENIKIACADEAIANEVGTGKTVAATGTPQGFDFTDSAKWGNLLSAELQTVIGDDWAVSSNTYRTVTTGDELVIAITNTNGVYSVVVDNLVEAVGGDMTSRQF